MTSASAGTIWIASTATMKVPPTEAEAGEGDGCDERQQERPEHREPGHDHARAMEENWRSKTDRCRRA